MKLKPYIISLFIVSITAFLGSYFTKENVNSEWYSCIKSTITPPNIIFPIAWTIIYILLFFCFSISIQKKYTNIISLLILIFILHVLWCYTFFTVKNVNVSLYIIVLINILNIITLQQSYKNKDKTLSILLLPHFIWIIFATLLNSTTLNKDCLSYQRKPIVWIENSNSFVQEN